MARFRRNAEFGKLYGHQVRVMARVVHDQYVNDLGADDLSMAYDLVRLGAYRVAAWDRNPMPEPTSPKVWPDFRHQSFSELADLMEAQDMRGVAVLSWPSNTMDRKEEAALLWLLHMAPTIAYLGKNTDGYACGFAELFRYLWTRDVLEHVPHRKNTLIVYGGERNTDEIRRPLPEELAGMTIDGPANVMSYGRSFIRASEVAKYLALD